MVTIMEEKRKVFKPMNIISSNKNSYEKLNYTQYNMTPDRGVTGTLSPESPSFPIVS